MDDGAGKLFDWDFPMIKWMESQGYDMTYVTSVDLESNPSLLLGHRVFMNTGHDEYYSDNMRPRSRTRSTPGSNMAFFSANNFYYRITWAPSANGSRTGASTATRTPCRLDDYEWRLLSPQHPENESAA